MEKLWGGRFKKPMDEEIFDFTKSISFDKRLALYDIEGSIAHAQMLGKCKIISVKEKNILLRGLRKIKREIENFNLEDNEDIHTAIINLLRKEVGELADKLHIARSRNDQVSLDMRMYCKEELRKIKEKIRELECSLLAMAKKFKNIIIPFYTHLKRAQCILFSHQLLSYIEMLERDQERFSEIYKRVDIMPLGSGAGRGTTLPIDRSFVAKKLGFSHLAQNSIDAVSDRDFVIEILSNLAILAMHLSRITEDFILFSSDEFCFLEGDDRHFTGSSMLPHKKNPDPLELVRGYTGKIFGNLLSVLVMMKGLPSSYNRDMQLDKPPLFESVEIVKDSLSILKKVLSGIKVKENVVKRIVEDESLFATDIAEFLIHKGYSWSRAHNCVGKLIQKSLEKNKPLKTMSEKEIKEIIPELNPRLIKELLNPWSSVRKISSYGGTSPESVELQIKKWERKLDARV